MTPQGGGTGPWHSPSRPQALGARLDQPFLENQGDPKERRVWSEGGSQPINPALSPLILMGLIWGCSLHLIPLVGPPIPIPGAVGTRGHTTPNSLWDSLTGGPGKPGWPWKPCGEKRAEKNPTDTPHSQTPQPDPAPCGSCWSCPPFGDTHLVPLLSSTSREAALAPGALRGDGIVGSQKFGVFSVLSGTVTAAELKLENSNWKLKFQLPNLS